MALGIGPGDEVITTPFTFFATAGCIARVGASPVFVDIDPRTLQHRSRAESRRPSPSAPRRSFPSTCSARCATWTRSWRSPDNHGLHVIEDAAQAITATYKGRKAGSIGTCGCFSFFPSKNLGAAGDGGMIVTNDSVLYERLSTMRVHGSKPKYYHKFVGGNFRLDPIQAAILLVKLPHLDAWSEARRHHAEVYDRAFAGSAVVTPWISPNSVSIYNQYVIRLSDRERVMAALREANIGSEIYYPLPMHKQECFAGNCRIEGSLTNCENAALEVLALPIYPELTDEQVACAANVVIGATQS